MASGKKPCARRDVLRSCPHSGDRAAAAGCPRALKPRVLKPRARKSAALHAEFPHPYCAQVRQIAASIRRSGFTGPVLFAGATPLLPGRGSAPARAGGIARPRVSSAQMSGCRWLITGLTCAGPVRPVTPPQARPGTTPWAALPFPPSWSLRFRSGRPARQSGSVCGFMQGWSADRRPVPHRNIPYRNRSPAGNCGPAPCHRYGHRQVPVPGQFSPCFFPCFFPEFPEKSGRDRLAAYCPHSQPHRRFCPLQICSGFIPCYLRVKNRRFRQRRFIQADIPPDTREVSAGVFHHPFRGFRPE